MKIKREGKDVVISLTEEEAYTLASMVEQSQRHNFIQEGKDILREEIKEGLVNSGIILEYI